MNQRTEISKVNVRHKRKSNSLFSVLPVFDSVSIFIPYNKSFRMVRNQKPLLFFIEEEKSDIPLQEEPNKKLF